MADRVGTWRAIVLVRFYSRNFPDSVMASQIYIHSPDFEYLSLQIPKIQLLKKEYVKIATLRYRITVAPRLFIWDFFSKKFIK